MKPEEFSQALKLLTENFWIVKDDRPDDYHFLKRHANELTRELRQRFSWNMVVRSHYIQLFKRPFELAAWMGNNGFSEPLDFALFCCGMAFTEDLEVDAAFMMDDLIRNLQLLVPEELMVDWNNYNHRKSLVRAVKKMEELRIIDRIQGDMAEFEQSENNLDILFATTPMARAFLGRAPQSYSQYDDFTDFWADITTSRSNLERNPVLYQRLMMEPMIQRAPDNEELFSLLRNGVRHFQNYMEEKTDYHVELYRDYAAFTLESRDGWREVFPSRQVVDEILMQLATLMRKEVLDVNVYGEVKVPIHQWHLLLEELVTGYKQYWSKEFSEMSLTQMSGVLVKRGKSWGLFAETEDGIIIRAVFGRLVAEMRTENDE